MSSRKHKASDMIHAWAKENGIRGYDQYDPQARAKRIQDGLKYYSRRHAVDQNQKSQYK